MDMNSTKMTAPEFFAKALARVESENVRKWATNEINYPIMIQLAEGALKKKNYLADEDFVARFSAWIVAKAIGLAD
jgi:hypothetical protein